MEDYIYRQFCSFSGEDKVKREEPMGKHTTFRIGGPAGYFLCPDTPEALKKIVEFCNTEEIPWFILGNGSNLLVSDRGYRGAVIQLHRNFQKTELEKDVIRAQAGALLSAIAAAALKAGLTGMEFASGIPGTLGGAVVMNAGAYGGEIRDILTETLLMDREGRIFSLPGEQLEMGYRTSLVKQKGWVVLEAKLKLQPGDPAQIRSRMEELKRQRCEKQPLEYPSAGSTFKRPEGYFAGKLIMDAGLRGFTVGGAQVLEKHCGFVINRGNASAEDVRSLIFQVQDRVYRQFGVKLEPEVRFLGEFEDTEEKSVVSRG